MTPCFPLDKRVSPKARRAIESSRNEPLLSDASLWEIALKQSIGKLVLAESFESRLTSAMERNAIGRLEIERSHVFGVARLPFHHRDPFDRLLISAAKVEGMPVVTDDPGYPDYDVELLW